MAFDYLSKAGALFIVTKVKDLLTDKVNKVDGKGLSTNDFTTDLLNKLNGIESGANAITVDSALSSTSTNPVQNKAVNTALAAKAASASPTLTGTPKAPTAAAGTNTTQIATTEFVTTAVANAIGNVAGISFEVVTSLPSTGTAGVIYLISNGSSESKNAYDEYVWTGSVYEKFGSTAVDLTGYLKETDLVEIPETELEAMFD